MKFIKEHKVEMILLAVILIIIIVWGVIFAVLWFGGSGDKYGSRLQGIEEVQISDKTFKKIEDKIKESDFVESISSSIQGKIINFTIHVKDETEPKYAKALTDIIMEHLSEKEMSFYDIQVFLEDSKTKEEKNEENTSKYPFIGYKHKTSESFVWSNN